MGIFRPGGRVPPTVTPRGPFATSTVGSRNSTPTSQVTSVTQVISSTLGGTPSDAQIPIGQAGGTYAPKTVSGDGTLADTGAITVTKTNGTSFGALATLGVGTGLASSGGNLNLQPASLAVIGGIKAINAVSHQWIASIDTSGVAHLSQPAFSDISGTAQVNQGGTGAITAPAARTDLGVIGFGTHGDANVTLTTADLPFTSTNTGLTAPRTWTLPLSAATAPGDPLQVADNGGINGANTLTLKAQGTDTLLGPGVTGNQITLTQPYSAATVYSTGTGVWLLYKLEPPQVLPTPTTTTLGGIKAVNAVSHQWVASIDTTGTPQLSQPAFTDISGTIGNAQVSGNYTNVTGLGTLGSNLAMTATLNNNFGLVTVTNNSNGSVATGACVFKNDASNQGAFFYNSSGNSNYAGASSLNLVNVANAPVGFGTNNALRWVIGANGGLFQNGVANQGLGTINVSVGVYLNAAAYTNPDYVLEHHYTGRVEKFADNKGAPGYAGLMPLDELDAYIREHWRLPRIHGDAMDIFERADVLLEKVEELTLHIIALERRIACLEGREELAWR